ncbi:tetratricopeptide repeat protein [Candidatus Villigracilis affinis]|uniref:tetratricopeptide repeat protein n=1 Tax=Candidatus Villigracilis affinis TaxID=3140682 RepID=UPI001DBF8A54|nr:tetratricopeptide repeat protein [Anaerolineales bacterium]
MANTQQPSGKQSDLSSILKTIWAPIVSLAGTVTLVVQFIELWRGDQNTVTLIIAIMGALLILAGLIWVGFGRITFEVPDFVSPGKNKLKSDWRYSKGIRQLAFAGIIAYFITGGVSGYLLVRHRQELEAKTIILIAKFDGPEENYGLTDELLEQLDDALTGYEDVQVVRLGEVVTVEKGSKYARKIGERYLADIVIWGWYRPTENPNVTIHVENLVPKQIEIIDASEQLKPASSSRELESFVLQQSIGEQMSSMVLIISGYAYYVAEDYQEALSRFERALALQAPSNELINLADIWFYTGEIHYSRNQLQQAIADYTEALTIDPEYIWAFSSRGYAYANLGLDEMAIADYTKTIELNPQCACIYYYNRGVAYGHLKEYEKAIADYTMAIKLDPTDDWSYNNRGNIYDRLERYNEAIADYTKAIELSPNDELYYQNRGETYTDLGKYDNALNDFNKAIELAPENAHGFNARAIGYEEMKEYEHALADYNKAIQLDPEYPSAYYNRALLYEILERYEDALADYTKAIGLNSKSALYYNSRGDLYYNHFDKYNEAMEDINKAINLDPKFVGAYHSRGRIYEITGDYEQALADYGEIIKLDPKYKFAYLGQGNIYYLLRQYDNAISEYTTVIGLDEKYAVAFYSRANSYFGLGQYEKSIIDYTTAIKIDPKYTNAYYYRASSYYMSGQYDNAIADYIQVIALDPGYAAAYCYRGFSCAAWPKG